MLQGFVQFIRKQGVVGLAVGFIFGGAVSKFVSAVVTDIINPVLGILLSSVGNLKDATWTVGSAVLKWGDLVSVAIDFVVIAAVVYFGVHMLGLDKLDHKDE
jgi:large conductance mechanosensitive channel